MTAARRNVDDLLEDLAEAVDAAAELSRSARTAGMPVLYVKAQGVPLPVEVKATYEGATSVIVLGRWNERVVVKVPSGATPFQTS